jgi:hypothetical protein
MENQENITILCSSTNYSSGVSSVPDQGPYLGGWKAGSNEIVGLKMAVYYETFHTTRPRLKNYLICISGLPQNPSSQYLYSPLIITPDSGTVPNIHTGTNPSGLP